MRTFIREACVETFPQILKAREKGADRIELCSALHLDGLTPSRDLITQAKKQGGLPIRAMIRPRGGDFVYNREELRQMESAIELCKTIGVEGVVFGVLNTDNTLDLDQIARLAKIAEPLKVIIHKAIDETPDPVEAFTALTNIDGVSGVLTSGGAETAFKGQNILKEMLLINKDRLEIVPAGKITAENIDQLHNLLGARSYHGKLIVGSLQ